MLLLRLAAASVVAAAAGGVVLPAAGPSTTPGTDSLFPRSLEAARLTGNLAFATDERGNLACWSRQTSEMAVWGPGGQRIWYCALDDPTLGSEPGVLALRGNRALLSFVNPAPGKEGSQQARLLDLDRCRVVGTLVLKGQTLDLLGANDGWVVVVGADSSFRERRALVVNDECTVVRSLSAGDELGRLSKQLGATPPSGAQGFRVIAWKKEVWLVPYAVYELWRPAQRAMPFKRVEPPACLAAQGVTLTGEENARHAEALSKNWPAEVRKSLRESIEVGGLNPSYLGCTAAAATNGNLVAVVVRDAARRGLLRLDLWDMLTERVVATLPFPGDGTLLSLGQDGAWLRRGDGKVERLELPDVSALPENVCTMLEAVRRSDGDRRDDAPGPPPGTPSR